ncbi:SDR family NAD(P)-dependent oxidoreductase [Paenibacillus pasadenensis]|uniref:Oxidoreductase, short-chain dehydrogenase/reductase family n=2 Tax=Paenibacillus TaxID=44249 RepID=A0A2N5N439_9BACL|nr:oxidoreductase, short-chain dehydrogenase/reductase family [Paenibacillus pasadenensis]
MGKNKIVVLTGASSGIGALTAGHLVRAGAMPVLCGRNEERLRQAAAAAGGRCATRVLDVTDDRSVEETFRSVLAEFGRIDVLINNAGFGLFKRFDETPLEEFRSMMETNYMGIVRCTQAALPAMKAQGSGHVINVASIAGKLATAKSSGYSASKHAVLGLTNALRQELAGSGIAVSAVNPGPIDTPFFEQADPDGAYVRNIGWIMMKPDRVARRIAGLVERPRDELDLPWLLAAGTRLYQLFPGIASRIAGPMLNKK